jgi:hypothetical protein
VELIKRKKIEEAMEIMQARIPKIFDEAYLMPFMKAHIFLRMVKEGTSFPTQSRARKPSSTARRKRSSSSTTSQSNVPSSARSATVWSGDLSTQSSSQ